MIKKTGRTLPDHDVQRSTPWAHPMNNRAANDHPYRCLIGICTTFIVTSTIEHYSLGQSLGELDAKSAGGMFARMWRTAAAQKTVQPSNPSIARNGKGELLPDISHLGVPEPPPGSKYRLL